MRRPRRNTTRIALLAVLGLCVALAGCSKAPVPGGSGSSRAVKGRKEAEVLAVDGFTAGAQAHARAVPEAAQTRAPGGSFVVAREAPSPKTAPRPGSLPLIRERVVTPIPYATEAEAEQAVRAEAAEWAARELAKLDPPLHYKPSPAEMWTEYIRKDSRALRDPDPEEKERFRKHGINGKLVYVEYDVEISAEQVRELRSQERVSGALRVLGGLIAVAVAGFLFLRADEWTRGYLTSWLALAAVTLAGAAAAALVFI